MSKVRVNFHLSQEIYKMVQDIANEEGSSAADIFRKAVRKYVYDYKTEDINRFYTKQKDVAIDCTDKKVGQSNE